MHNSEFKGHLLVIDDDDRIRELLSKFLSEKEYLVSSSYKPEQIDNLLKLFDFDLIILDVMMPKISGFDLLNEIRKNYSTPVLMLTALGDTEDKVKGLEIGADDYLVKPFEPRELTLRIERIVSRYRIRSNNSKANLIKFGINEFDLTNNKLTKNGNIILLTSQEAKLLNLFASNINKMQYREDLAKFLGGVNDRTVDVQIIRLRNKLEDDPKKPLYLKTIRGEGYILNN